jgi:hypothetical protein
LGREEGFILIKKTCKIVIDFYKQYFKNEQDENTEKENLLLISFFGSWENLSPAAWNDALSFTESF